MLDLNTLKTKGTTKFKRVGRGTSSGHGKTCGRGNKGQGSRSGGTKGKRFEGGQTPFYRRLPKKRGFKNLLFKKVYNIVNISQLESIGSNIAIDDFVKNGFMKQGEMIKVLGMGQLKKPINVTANAFTKSAKEAIEKAGGKATIC